MASLNGPFFSRTCAVGKGLTFHALFSRLSRRSSLLALSDMAARGAVPNTVLGSSAPPASVAAVYTNCLRVIPRSGFIMNAPSSAFVRIPALSHLEERADRVRRFPQPARDERGVTCAARRNQIGQHSKSRQTFARVKPYQDVLALVNGFASVFLPTYNGSFGLRVRGLAVGLRMSWEAGLRQKLQGDGLPSPGSSVRGVGQARGG